MTENETKSEKIHWKSEKRKIEELIPSDYNPRKLSEKQYDELTRSIERFDFVDPLIINLNNRLIGGHQRLKVLKAKGLVSADVRVPNRLLSETEEKELNLRLNKNAGDWDYELLQAFHKDMLKDVGFDSKELDKIFDFDVDEDDDKVPETPETAVTKRGDIYIMGNHRLMCGDSTNAEDVAALMEGKKAALCLTDPPYSVDYKSRKEKTTQTLDSYQDPKNAEDLLTGFLAVMPTECLVMSYADKHLHEYVRILDLIKFETIDVLIWKKHHFTFWMGARYQQGHELIFLARKKGAKFYSNTESNATTVIEIDRQTKNDMHPTQKPLELWNLLMRNHSERGDLIYEPFGGSGTTFISAEKCERACYGLEISELFCDVIVKRWEDFTGETAIKQRIGGAENAESRERATASV